MVGLFYNLRYIKYPKRVNNITLAIIEQFVLAACARLGFKGSKTIEQSSVFNRECPKRVATYKFIRQEKGNVREEFYINGILIDVQEIEPHLSSQT